MFTWRPIYLEIAHKLPEFQFKSAELVELVKAMHDANLKAISFMDRDAKDHAFPLEEMDPFTFMANFNRPITDANRKAILQFLKARWSLSADIPADFAGLPVVSLMKSWFMPFKFRRQTDHVPTLWQFFVHIVQAEHVDQLDGSLFDACLKLLGVGRAYLTMGMFWCRPDLWLSLDSKNVAYSKKRWQLDKPDNGAEYKAWLCAIRAKLTESPWEFSHQAHVEARQGGVLDPPLSTLAEPYARLFDDLDHANEVLDRFAQVLNALGSDEDDETTVVAFSERGRQGGVLRVSFGRWVVFGYRRRKGDSSYAITLPHDHADATLLSNAYRFTNPKNKRGYVFGWVEEEWLDSNWNSHWPDLLDALTDIREIFSGISSSPYWRFHIPEFFSLIVDPNIREEVLKTPLDKEPPPKPEYWLLAPGPNAVLWDEVHQQGIAVMGWDDIGDLNHFQSKEEIEAKAEQVDYESSPTAMASMLWSFFDEIKPGDVIFAKDGLFKIRGWGIVAGNYRFESTRESFKHVIPVQWQANRTVAVPDGMQLAGRTLSSVSSKHRFLEAMAAAFSGIPGLDSSEKGPGETQIVPTGYTREDALKDLFIDENTLDRIVRLLKRKKNVVLQGAPGTGKTFIARRLAYLLMGEQDQDRAPMMQFHQSTTYEDFIQGYRPTAEAGGFALKTGPFLEFCERARKQTNRDFVFIIDEINRGNLSKIFGELLMLIEHDKRDSSLAVPLTYAQGFGSTVFIPANVYLIGTMNTADRSLALVDYAMRRRFSFVELQPSFDSPVFVQYLKAHGATMDLIQDIRSRMNAVNQLIEDDVDGLGRGYRIGHSFFVPSAGHTADEAWLEEIVEHEVVPLLEEYWCDDPQALTRALNTVRGQ